VTLHSYLLFVFASLVRVLVPGPDMVYMLARCIAQGRRSGVLAALGFNLGGYVHLTAAVFGLSTILATSSFAFNVVKWLGAGYLIYLGFGALRRNQGPLVISPGPTNRDGRTIFWQAFLSDALNPKVAMFFLAFLPQFVDAKGSHPTLQIILLGVTVNMIAQGGLRDLVEAVMLTGARAGELTSATRAQFDARTMTMTFIGKTGTRTVPLSDAAAALFVRLSKSKLPAAQLFTRDDGRPWAHSDWDQLIREAAAIAKLPDGCCLYTLRHSFITEAISQGMTTLDVARLCGTSVLMIEKHYGHLVADAARDRLSRVAML
jgi:threonine/homoserine/homoserine lactone efflux protein